MSGGVNLSFSMATAGWKTAIFVVVFAVLGFTAPLAYFAWWGFGGGAKSHARRRIVEVVKTDPAEEARKAIERGDYRLYVTGTPFDGKVPGYGIEDEDYAKRFGYKSVALVHDRWINADDEGLNRELIDHMRTYNRCVHDHVDREFPDWKAQQRVAAGVH